MRYEIIAQKNPDYLGPVWAELQDLYSGGWDLYAKANKYLPRQANEHEALYQERLRLSSYIPYLPMVVDFFSANLFDRELSLHPAGDANDPSTIGDSPLPDHFWEIFAHDADRCRTPFARLLRGVFSTAILKKKALICADFPDKEEVAEEIRNRAEEDKLGLSRAYIYEIPVEHMLDWEYDDDGDFEWCITCERKSERKTLSDKRDHYHHEFKYYKKQEPGSEGGLVDIEIYRSKDYKLTESPSKDDEVSLVKTVNTNFRRIPILELRVPDGLWVGNKIGLLAKEHYQRRSALNSAEAKSLFAIPVAKLGSEMGAAGGEIPSEKAQNPNRGNDPVGQFRAKGFMVVGEKDTIEFAEPAGSAYELVERQLEKLVDEMFRVVHQMASSVTNTKVGLYRSAASKHQDRLTTEIVLSEYGSIVKDFSKEVYELISEARGENVIWMPVGLDKYDLEDRTTVLQEAIQMSAITIPSKTFRKEYMGRVAQSLIGDMPPETVKAIRQEIESAVDNDEDVMGLVSERPDPELLALGVTTPGAERPSKETLKSMGMSPGGEGGGGDSGGGGKPGGGGNKKIPRRGAGGKLLGSVSVK